MKLAKHLSLLFVAMGSVVLLGLCGSAAAQKMPAGTPPPPIQPLPATTAGPSVRPQIVNIAYNTYFLNEFGMDSQYLLIGTKRALLIDTGTGYYDIKGTVESLTNLPYDVVVTHGHHDHTGMAGAFDTIYKYEVATPPDGPRSAGERSQKGSQDQTGSDAPRPAAGKGAGGEPPNGCKTIWGDLKLRTFDKQPVIKPLHEGQAFDLGGGRIVTVYYVPGHTVDSCSFLDRKMRILFSGDAILPAAPIHGTSPVAASTRLRSWIKLQNLGSEYDRIFYGHTNSGCEVSVKPLAPDILGNLIEIYRQVLRGEAKFQKIERNDSSGRYRAVLNNAQVDVEPDHLWEPGEPHLVP
jgi:hydroxyacylglutathione hydrolase